MNPFVEPAIETFEAALLHDATVNRLYRSGVDASVIVATLAREKQLLLKRVVELESLCPKKMKAKDGTVYVWQCPVELIPFTA